MRNIYVLDTSALIDNPSIFQGFKDSSQVILHITVLEELDKLKKCSNEVGKNARVLIKYLDKISDLGDITNGVLLDNNVLLKIDAEDYDYKLGDPLYGDTRILACAFNLQKNNPNDNINFITNDINLRVRAKALGIQTQADSNEKSSTTDIYTGIVYIEDSQAGSDLLIDSFIDPKDYQIEDLLPNQLVCFIDENNDEIALGRVHSNGIIKYIKRAFPWGISPKNIEQTGAVDLLLDNNIKLVTLNGLAGGGKSLLALSCGLELVLNKQLYDKFLIYRPTHAVSKDIGFLPGDLDEKLHPWFAAILDNFEVLFSMSNGDKWKSNLELFMRKERIKFEAITYIRGRSISNAVILIDEASNLSKEDIRTILTRAGNNTKIILTGDISQIDNPALDPINNGLTYVIEQFKNQKIAGHITLTQGERSELATISSEIL